MSGYVPPRPDAASVGPVAPESWAYEGKRYSIGSAAGLWGIWVKGVPGAPPIETFPQDQAGWGRAWLRLRELEAVGELGVPFFRRSGVGWVLLNLVIAALFWFGLLLMMGIFVAIAGRNISGPTPDDTRLGVVSLASLVSAEVGWLLFCYLRRSNSVRRITLGAIYGATVLLGAILISPLYPRT